MSKIIKSFRVLEREAVDKVVQESKGTENVDNIVKEILLQEARTEADVIVKIAEEKSKQILKEIETQRINIIEAANIQSKEILEKAKNDGYNEGHEKGFQEGLQDGFNKGYNEGKTVSDNLVKESLDIKNDYINTRNNLLEELEDDIIQLVIGIYEKILDRQMEEDHNTIISLVLNGIKNLDPTDKLTIVVSKDDFNILEMARDEILAKASLINELEIKYDINLSKGDCILETSKGNIDISIKDQMSEVKELLTTILNNE